MSALISQVKPWLDSRGFKSLSNSGCYHHVYKTFGNVSVVLMDYTLNDTTYVTGSVQINNGGEGIHFSLNHTACYTIEEVKKFVIKNTYIANKLIHYSPLFKEECDRLINNAKFVYGLFERELEESE